MSISIHFTRLVSRIAFPVLEMRIRQAIAAQDPQSAIDLGCGGSPRNKFNIPDILGVDLHSADSGSVVVADLSREPIPAGDRRQQLVTAFDFLEHIPRWERATEGLRSPFLDLMNDVHRVLEPGGLFYAETPAFPMAEAFQDPTHVNIVTPKTFSHYLAGPAWARQYGYTGRFKLVFMGWRVGHLVTLMQRSV